MKKSLMLLIFVLLFPFMGFAQNVSDMKGTKYEDLVSKTGIIFTTQTYHLGTVHLASAYVETHTEDLTFSVVKIINGTSSAVFLRISHMKGLTEKSSAMIEDSDVKGLVKAINDMNLLRGMPVPEGAFVKHTYMGADGVTVTLWENMWKIKLERYTQDSLDTKKIDLFLSKLQESMKKMASLK